MDNNKSDTLSQRKKAQQKFLELKRMQEGEVVPEGPPPEIRPKTFKEKIINFWFHYKIHTLLVAFFTIVFAVGITQCSKQEHYDGRVMLYVDHVCADAEAKIYEDYLTPFFTDTNGDGEIKVQIINCAYTTEGSFDMNYTSALASKLQSIISSEPDVQLFIVDPKKLDQLNNISEEVDEFFVDTAAFPEDIYKVAKEQGFPLPDGLLLGRRIVSGTLIENAENIDAYTKQAEDVLNAFKK